MTHPAPPARPADASTLPGESAASSFLVRFATDVTAAFVDPPAALTRVLQSELRSLILPFEDSPEHAVKIRFVDQIPRAPGMVRIGVAAAYQPGAFFVIDGASLAQVSFDELDSGRVEILAERGFDATRLLGYVVEPLVRIVAVTRGVVYVHSSSISLGGRGVVFPAWGHTGKTNIMLSLTALHGARFLADDWSVLEKNGVLRANPRYVNLFDYNLRHYPELYRHLPLATHGRVRGAAVAKRLTGWLAERGNAVRKPAELADQLLDRLANARVDPDLIGTGGRAPTAPLTAAIALVAVDGCDDPVLTPIKASFLARRMKAVFEYEHARTFQYLQAYRFATGADDLLAPLMEAYGELLHEYLSPYRTYQLTVGRGLAPQKIAEFIAQFVEADAPVVESDRVLL